MQHLYDYFARAEDPRFQAEELLRCCAYEFFASRGYAGKVDEDIEAVLDSFYVEEDIEGYIPREALDAIEENHPEVWDSLLEFRDEFFVEYAQEELPSWVLLWPRWGDEEYDWLIHFSDDAYDIASEGFCRGVEDITKLGLTTHLGSHEFGTEGYNFAYPAEFATRFGFDRHRPRYGKHAVLFRAPYMMFDHLGDREPQAIFWGPSARDITLIDFEYKEPVLETRTRVLVAESGEVVAVDEGLEMAEEEALEEEHGGEWTDRIEFTTVEEMLEWLEGPPIDGETRLSLFDPLSKPLCVMKARITPTEVFRSYLGFRRKGW